MLELIGGPDRDRTDDLFHAMEARSQLRHRPTQRKDSSYFRCSGLRSQTDLFAVDSPRPIIFKKMGTIGQETGVYKDRVSEHSAAGGAVFSWMVGALG